MHLASTDAANALLERDPLDLLIGMLLDQQIPMEKAFTSPAVLAERMGVQCLDAAAIAHADPEEMVQLFRTPPALHRYPAAMAERTQGLCQALLADYDGRAQAVWQDVTSGAQLVTRLGGLPGFGAQKARIFTALLGKQLGVRPTGWQEAAGAYGEAGYRSIADVVDEDSLVKVRAFKQEQKAAAKAKATPAKSTPVKSTPAKAATATSTPVTSTPVTSAPAKAAKPKT